MSDIDLEACNQTFNNTMAQTLGMKVIDFTKGRVVATMPVDTKTHQPYGLLHGGASVALAESIASMGGWYLVQEEGKIVVGQEINANHLRSVTSGTVTGEGVIIHKGKASQVWEIKIYDDSKNLICISRCTLAVIKPRSSEHGVKNIQ